MGGFWLNNFAEYEKRLDRENRLILNFYYVPGPGEKPKSVKAYVKKDVKIPTNIIPSSRADLIADKIKSDESLKDYAVSRQELGSFSILDISMPNDSVKIRCLGKDFQKGSYDKMLRFSGFFPERKVKFNKNLEERMLESEEIELESMEGLEIGGFPALEEWKQAPYVVIDIEKPLWKNEEQKAWLKERTGLLKKERGYARLSDKKKEESSSEHEERLGKIKSLEDLLTIETGSLGKIGLYEDRFKADISFVTTVWVSGKEIRKDVFLIDPLGDCDLRTHNGYTLITFKNERELLESLKDRFKEMKPLVSFGHNQVYDHTQIRFAAESYKMMFDPGVKDVKVKRDFVQSFVQRMRQDLIFIDTMNQAAIYYPFLKQRSFGTSLRLADVCKQMKILFDKSLSHEELKFVELERLGNPEKDKRRSALYTMLKYATEDVINTNELVKALDVWPLILKVKDTLPFQTVTRIAFSPNCMNDLFEYKHFIGDGSRKKENLPFSSYGQKERTDERFIFAKRFSGLKREMLRWAGLGRAHKGIYRGVEEFYVPLEEWLSPLVFKRNSDLKRLYERTAEEPAQRFAVLQYIDTFMRNAMLTDYYHARKSGKNYMLILDRLRLGKEESQKCFGILENNLQKEDLDSLLGSYRYMKNLFRSLYVALMRSGNQKYVRLFSENFAGLNFPVYMETDAELYLLQKSEDKIKGSLSQFQKKQLATFIATFDRFEFLLDKLSSDLSKKAGGSESRISMQSKGITYAYVKYMRAKKYAETYYRRYGASVDETSKMIASSYGNLADIISISGARFLEEKGDYIFLQTDKKQFGCLYHIRSIGEYEVK
jgi:hypothetical protein